MNVYKLLGKHCCKCISAMLTAGLLCSAMNCEITKRHLLVNAVRKHDSFHSLLTSIRYRLFYRVVLHKLCIFRNHFTKFGQLIVRKIITIVATRCKILRLKCTKVYFSWGCIPDPTGGGYSAPPDLLAGIKGNYF